MGTAGTCPTRGRYGEGATHLCVLLLRLLSLDERLLLRLKHLVLEAQLLLLEVEADLLARHLHSLNLESLATRRLQLRGALLEPRLELLDAGLPRGTKGCGVRRACHVAKGGRMGKARTP